MGILLVAIVTLIVLVISYFKWQYQYWKKRNLPYLEPTIPFGSPGNPFTRKITFGEVLKNFHDEFKAKGYKHGGFYAMANPVYMPVDLDYIKNVLAKDFSYFTDRGIFYNEKDDPLTAHLFALGGSRWKNLRAKLSPTFTSGKMRMMFKTLVDCTEPFKDIMVGLAESGKPIDIKDALGRFTTDVIGSCAFGLDCNSIKDENSPFRQHGKGIFTRSIIRSFINNVAFSFPKFSKAIGFKSTKKETTDFFMKVVRDTIGYREKNNVVRNDFMQILIDLKNNKIDNDTEEKHDGLSLTVKEIAAQCFVFFLAGFETSSTVMTFALFEMARNPDIQEKVRREILTVLAKYNGEITYDGLAEMKYLEQVINESMRLYPPVSLLIRRCVKNYKVPDTDIVVEKGIRVLISVLGIHHDKEFYDNPEVFDPERFSDENKKHRHPFAFLPFGEGPRICIGLRFGLMQSKVGLSVLLKNFRFSLDGKTKVPLKFSRESLVTSAEGGIWLRAECL